MHAKLTFIALLAAGQALGAEVLERREPDSLAQECYRSLHRTEVELAPCESALAAALDDGGQALIASGLALLHARRGDLERAQTYMDEALERAPDSPIVQMNLATLRIKQGRFSEAVEGYGRAQDLGAIDEPVLYLNRALALRALGRYADAKQDFDHYLLLRGNAERFRPVADDPARVQDR